MGFFSRKSKQSEIVPEHRPVSAGPAVTEEQQRMNRIAMEEQLAADRARREGRTE